MYFGANIVIQVRLLAGKVKVVNDGRNTEAYADEMAVSSRYG